MTPPHRRRSVDSSDSSVHDQPQSNTQHMDKHTDSSSGDAQVAFPIPKHHDPPPSYTPPAGPAAQVPPSGYRVPLGATPGQPFPGIDRTREAPCTDADGKSPVFLGSAIMEDGSVHPCKIAPGLTAAPCRVPFGGGELEHRGRYDLLPFVPELMEFVVTSRGQVPPGRRPVKGGFEKSGLELYHAVAVVNGVRVPGKTNAHLSGCNVAFGGVELVVREKYEILCWKH
ncbi:hypothetical protein EDB85DRAFT_1935162 [Lactarius pseudohatsudake]|nr:hypothetical protein EDB85DRAFT_1935162 [Lactarius pseudohatsudake]